MLTLEDVFPPFALRISCGPVQLTVLRDDDLPELVELVRGGIQAPGLPMPFLRAWHEEPFAPGAPDGFPTTSLVWWWTQRATFAPDDWRLALVVRRDGALVGMQDVHARNLAQTRTVETGSWLGRAHQGQGTGTLMRRLVDESRRPWRREQPTEVLPDVAHEHTAEERLALLDALRTLPAMQRAVVVLRYWDDLPVTETALALGISEGTVKSHASRGLAALRTHLERTPL